MTVRDMVDRGIEIQGKVIVKQWIEAKNEYKVLAETDAAIFTEKALDKEITYMWAEGDKLIIETK